MVELSNCSVSRNCLAGDSIAIKSTKTSKPMGGLRSTTRKANVMMCEFLLVFDLASIAT